MGLNISLFDTSILGLVLPLLLVLAGQLGLLLVYARRPAHKTTLHGRGHRGVA